MSFRMYLLLFLAVVTRFIGVNWGSGYFFNPDENNMVRAIMQMSSGDLNPHFFAYGQFPLYLTYFTRQLLHLPTTYEVTTYLLRFWSATFAVASVFVFYKLAKKIASPNVAFVGSLIFIFTPGLIQLAHFGTTESLLVLIFLINILISFNLSDHPNNLKSYLLSSLATGIGIASKLSALIFIFPILFVSLLNFIKLKSKLKTILLVELTLLATLLFFVIFSPYNLLERSDFLSALKYETDVATGALPVFYTTQFSQTQSYIFQITKIFPYVASWPLVILSLLGTFIYLRHFSVKKTTVFLSVVLYFLYFGQLYVKWTRFMSPVFFMFPLLSAFAITKLRSKIAMAIALLIAIAPGMYFLRLYMHPDIRVTASNWLVDNIPQNSRILSEGGNVIDIPLTAHNLDVTNFDFYSVENSPQSIDRLVQKIADADYIIVPSRRVFMNQNGSDFPVSQRYFQSLFSGQLGFIPIKSFTPKFDLLSNAEQAEETWTVFDRPTIRVFKKINSLSVAEYENIIK